MSVGRYIYFVHCNINLYLKISKNIDNCETIFKANWKRKVCGEKRNAKSSTAVICTDIILRSICKSGHTLSSLPEGKTSNRTHVLGLLLFTCLGILVVRASDW
uniref:Uncharacterized protein n=1 Tax=Cacopsylla melanoneura TaxID=428564 RepID=A0A8D8VV91_9HEMI